MARSVLTLALLGLGAVQALPTQPIEERQVLGGGWSTLTPGDSGASPSPCLGQSPPGAQISPCFVAPPVTGGLVPPKVKRQGSFGLGSGPSETSRVIEEFEKELEELQNKPDKSEEDLQRIGELKVALQYLAGITGISAPPGSSTTFRPGKRQGGGPAIGGQACQLVQSLGLIDSLREMYRKYGPPSQAPPHIAEQERALIEIIRQCEPYFQEGSFPAGPVTPDPTTPGGSLNPDPTYPGGELNPDPVDRGSPFGPSH